MNSELGGAAPAMRPMRVDQIALDAQTRDPVVILSDDAGQGFLPIFIGPLEASSIALALHGVPSPRPLPHDLMKSMLDSMRARVTRIIINDIRDNTFYCTVDIDTGQNIIHLDARPSDGIALALRTHAPIFVSGGISLLGLKTTAEAQRESFKTYLENLKPSDFLSPDGSADAGFTS